MEPASAEQKEQLAQALGEAERLNRFVGNLLDMVRIEAGSLEKTIEPVDLVDSVASAVHDLRSILGANQVSIDIAPDLPLVRVDPQLFHHCLINLIENAAKYGRVGAPIGVRARREPGALMLEVIDEGPGLPAGQEKLIFETFTRLEGTDRTGGTGLGLAIVKGFAEAMGLSVSAANRLDGDGAVFTIRFPEESLMKGDLDV